MAGVVLETLSNKKLISFAVFLLLLQVTAYLLGGLICPKPYNVIQVTGTLCKDLRQPDDYDHKKWFWSRVEGSEKHEPCVKASDEDLGPDSGIDANQMVFVFQFPLPREKMELDFSRWHQTMVGVFYPTIEYRKDHQVGKKAVMTIHSRLGARDKHEPVKTWREIGSSLEDRMLTCEPPKKKSDGLPYHCEPLPMFELGSVHYDHYLLNVRLPAFDDMTNAEIGKIVDLHMVVIHPNGGFIKVWFSFKIVSFPIILVALIWYWVRVLKLSREPSLLEKTLFALGAAMTFLNLPVEVFTLWCYMPFMLVYSDIRQGLFYSVLLCFWVIFAGEHLMDTIQKNSLYVYWKQLGGVLFGCICLFAFELCERGVQLANPFYSIWSNETTSNLAAFIILAGIAACVYFLFLLGMMIRVWRSINLKRGSLPTMTKARRKYYSGIIFRFKFMIVATLLCAALTVVFFIVGQTTEGHWKWDEPPYMEYSSAFLTGVYGMWNLYVLSLLVLYAPSHKVVTSAVHEEDSEGEEIEFSNVPTETSAIAEFARKAAAD